MMFYAVYDKDTGALVSTGTRVADDAVLTAADYGKREYIARPGSDMIWDPKKRNFVVAPTPAPKPERSSQASKLADLRAILEDALSTLAQLEADAR
jgi:hypothetical protein